MWMRTVKTRKSIELELEMVQIKNDVIEASKIIEWLSAGEYQSIDKLEYNKNSKLITSLLNFKDKFVQLSIQDQQQNWINSGLAMFVNILRVEGKKSEKLYSEIISALVKYVQANQAGIFILNKSKQLELKACYAYGRAKQIQKILEPGDGLLGQCFIEGETTLLTDVPDKFTEITSGLGEATPNTILLVPLKVDKETVGVLEMASFKLFEKYEISFIERLCENIAVVVKETTNNEEVKELLAIAEQTKQMLQSQEEEMRQTMEELYATQDELTRREKETKSLLEELKEKYNIQLKEVESRELELKKQKDLLLKAVTIDNILIDVAGRNRMLSQKIGFLCEMIYSGKKQYITQLAETIELHDNSLKVIKLGGKAPAINAEYHFPPCDSSLHSTIESVEKKWLPFKEMASVFLNSNNDTSIHDTALEYIENNGLELLKTNNELVSKCIEFNKNKLLTSGIMQM
jgi:GAF domain-containing protein